nr:integrase, catalytic region, zinc finger, CCHC-type, peptidase aspartic, catalytic [Tanacetum cinerariifolium]
MQGLLNATTIKVKDIWLGNALSLRDQGMQYDPGVPDNQAIQTIIPNNAAFQTEDLDTYDSDCDDISNAKAVLMANISNYGFDVISEVPHSETYFNDMENQGPYAFASIWFERFLDVVKSFGMNPNENRRIGVVSVHTPREAHKDYLKYTQEQADILQGIVKQAKAKQPLDNVVQIVLWYLDFEYSKHMTGNRSQLMNFVSKFLGTVRFKNDHIARIIGHGDYQLGNVTILTVYYVEGLRHNLFFVGQFCDTDLEVAFRKNTCFIRNIVGVDLLSGSQDTNLYTISLDDMLKRSSIYLLSKALKAKSWLWHRRLSHLNFGTLNKLAKDGLARGILRLKF